MTTIYLVCSTFSLSVENYKNNFRKHLATSPGREAEIALKDALHTKF